MRDEHGAVLFGRKLDGFGAGKFHPPGGKHEPSDASLRSTVVRETEEESGLLLDADRLRNLGSIIVERAEATTTLHFLEADVNAYTGVPTDSAEMGDWQWVLPKNVGTLDMLSTDRMFMPFVAHGIAIEGLLKANSGDTSSVVSPGFRTLW